MSNPSIGSIGTVELDEPNKRFKGVIPALHGSQKELYRLLTDVARQSVGDATRLCVRTFVGHGVDAAVQGVTWRGEPLELEAFVPVMGHRDVAGYAYYGVSLPRRRQPNFVRSGEDRLLEGIARRPPKDISRDRHVELLNGQTTDADIAQLLRVYQRYDGYLVPFTMESIRDLITGSRVMIARDKHGQIVSVCVGEVMTFDVEGTCDPVLFAELSDAATAKTHEGQGFYTATKVALIQQLRAEDPHVVITTEGRANSGGVLRSNLGIGMRRAGYQPSHCVISSSSDEAVPQVGPFGNLVVFYVP